MKGILLSAPKVKEKLNILKWFKSDTDVQSTGVSSMTSTEFTVYLKEYHI